MKGQIAIGAGILGLGALLTNGKQSSEDLSNLERASISSEENAPKIPRRRNLEHEVPAGNDSSGPSALTLKALNEGHESQELVFIEGPALDRTRYLEGVAHRSADQIEGYATRSLEELERDSARLLQSQQAPETYRPRSRFREQMGSSRLDIEPMLELKGDITEGLGRDIEREPAKELGKKAQKDEVNQQHPVEATTREKSAVQEAESDHKRLPGQFERNRAPNGERDLPSLHDLLVLPETTQTVQDTMATMVRSRDLSFVDTKITDKGTEYIYQRIGSGENIEVERLTFIHQPDGGITARYEGTNLKPLGLELLPGDQSGEPNFPLGKPSGPMVKIPARRIEGSNGFACDEWVHRDGSLTSWCSEWSLFEANVGLKLGFNELPSMDFSIRGPHLKSSSSHLFPPTLIGDSIELRGVKATVVGGPSLGFSISPKGASLNNGTGGASGSVHIMSTPLNELPDGSFREIRDGLKTGNKRDKTQ